MMALATLLGLIETQVLVAHGRTRDSKDVMICLVQYITCGFPMTFPFHRLNSEARKPLSTPNREFCLKTRRETDVAYEQELQQNPYSVRLAAIFHRGSYLVKP